MTRSSMKLLENLPFETDEGIAARASLGLIVLATDYTVEYEWSQIIRQFPGVALYHTRISNDDEVTPETLRAMEPKIRDCAAQFTPGTPVDVIAYGCTSASMAIGETTVFNNIKAAQSGSQCTTPITAAFAAFNAFKAKRIAVLTPYSASVNEIVKTYITDRGFTVPVFGSFNEPLDSVVANISPDSIRNGIHTIIKDTAVDAIFVSCTSVRLVDQIQTLEQETGLPVTSSNHAMGWHALRLAGITDSASGLGLLFDQPLPSTE